MQLNCIQKNCKVEQSSQRNSGVLHNMGKKQCLQVGSIVSGLQGGSMRNIEVKYPMQDNNYDLEEPRLDSRPIFKRACPFNHYAVLSQTQKTSVSSPLFIRNNIYPVVSHGKFLTISINIGEITQLFGNQCFNSKQHIW